MNSEITVYDIKVIIKDQIDYYIKDLFADLHKFDKVINLDDLYDWHDEIEYNIKILKNLKLLENEIDSKNSFKDNEINSYHTLACKPERISIRNKRKNKHLKYLGPMINKYDYQ